MSHDREWQPTITSGMESGETNYRFDSAALEADRLRVLGLLHARYNGAQSGDTSNKLQPYKEQALMGVLANVIDSHAAGYELPTAIDDHRIDNSDAAKVRVHPPNSEAFVDIMTPPDPSDVITLCNDAIRLLDEKGRKTLINGEPGVVVPHPSLFTAPHIENSVPQYAWLAYQGEPTPERPLLPSIIFSFGKDSKHNLVTSNLIEDEKGVRQGSGLGFWERTSPLDAETRVYLIALGEKKDTSNAPGDIQDVSEIIGGIKAAVAEAEEAEPQEAQAQRSATQGPRNLWGFMNQSVMPLIDPSLSARVKLNEELQSHTASAQTNRLEAQRKEAARREKREQHEAKKLEKGTTQETENKASSSVKKFVVLPMGALTALAGVSFTFAAAVRNTAPSSQHSGIARLELVPPQYCFRNGACIPFDRSIAVEGKRLPAGQWVGDIPAPSVSSNVITEAGTSPTGREIVSLIAREPGNPLHRFDVSSRRLEQPAGGPTCETLQGNFGNRPEAFSLNPSAIAKSVRLRLDSAHRITACETSPDANFSGSVYILDTK